MVESKAQIVGMTIWALLGGYSVDKRAVAVAKTVELVGLPLVAEHSCLSFCCHWNRFHHGLWQPSITGEKL